MAQRELGIDTRSYDEALRRAMREALNMIMIGEIRDGDTMQHALHYAESGPLCGPRCTPTMPTKRYNAFCIFSQSMRTNSCRWIHH